MTEYPKNWTEASITKYITQEAQEKDREAFAKTHVSIDRIRVEENKAVSRWADEDEQLVDEEIVYETVTASTLEQGNRLFFIVGESGSGKSELCQWLDYEIQDEAEATGETEFAHEPILIPRHVREPRDVLQLLTDELEGWDFDDARYLANLPESGIFKSVAGSILNQFDRRQEATVDFLNDAVFEDIIRSNLRTYVDSFNDPDESVEFEPIAREELESLLEKGFPRVPHEHESHTIEPTEYLYREIKTAATDAIEDMLFDGDITDVLHDIDEAYQARNRRPVLIIEDLTGFTIYDHQVLSFFSDLGAAHFDVVVGVTTGVHQRLIDQRRADVSSEDTINDRTEARFKLTEAAENESGSRTLFLEQENVHIDLARKYLTAIKSEDDIPYEPSLPDGLNEDDVEKAFSDGLYPFNEPFLTRIYDNLQEDNVKKQTPRIYLTFVIEELLNNENPPFEHAEKLQQRLGVVHNPISADYKGADEPVLKWYGSRAGQKQVVDERIPQVFSIESEGEVPIVSGATDICPECGTQIFQDSDEWTCPECGYESRGERPPDKPTKREIFNEHRDELLAWRREETDFNQTTNIERGAERVIRYFHDRPDSLVRPECFSSEAAYIRWEKGGTRIPVHVDNGDEPNFTQITLAPDQNEKLLLDLLRVGVWDEVALSNHDRNGDVDIERLREWADEAVDSLRSSVESDIESTYGADIDEITIFGKYLLNVFTGESTDLTAEALATPVDEDDIRLVFARTRFEGDLNRLKDRGNLLRGLFQSRFHLRKNVVDRDRLEEKLEHLDRETLLLRVSSLEGTLRGLKIGPKASETIEFDEFLKTPTIFNLRGYATDINEFSSVYGTDLEPLREEFDRLYENLVGIERGIDTERLHTAYTPLSRQRPDTLAEIEAYDRDIIKDVRSEIKDLVTHLRRCDSVWEYFIAQQRAGWLKYNEPYKDVLGAMSSLVDELEDLESDLDRRIEELEEKTFTPDEEPFVELQSEATKLENTIGGRD